MSECEEHELLRPLPCVPLNHRFPAITSPANRSMGKPQKGRAATVPASMGVTPTKTVASGRIELIGEENRT